MIQLALAFVLRHVLTPNTFSHLFLDFTTKNQTLSEKVKLLKMKKKNTQKYFSDLKKNINDDLTSIGESCNFYFSITILAAHLLYITGYASKSIGSYQSSNYWPSIIRFPNRSLLSERKNFLHSCIILFVLANIIIEILDDWC